MGFIYQVGDRVVVTERFLESGRYLEKGWVLEIVHLDEAGYNIDSHYSRREYGCYSADFTWYGHSCNGHCQDYKGGWYISHEHMKRYTKREAPTWEL